MSGCERAQRLRSGGHRPPLQLYLDLLNVLRKLQIKSGCRKVHVHFDVRELHDHVIAAGFRRFDLNWNPSLLVDPQLNTREQRRCLRILGLELENTGLPAINGFFAAQSGIVDLLDVLFGLAETDEHEFRLVLVLPKVVFLNLLQLRVVKKGLAHVDQHALLFGLVDLDLDSRISTAASEVHGSAVRVFVIHKNSNLRTLQVALHRTERLARVTHLGEDLIEGVGILCRGWEGSQKPEARSQKYS